MEYDDIYYQIQFILRYYNKQKISCYKEFLLSSFLRISVIHTDKSEAGLLSYKVANYTYFVTY